MQETHSGARPKNDKQHKSLFDRVRPKSDSNRENEFVWRRTPASTGNAWFDNILRDLTKEATQHLLQQRKTSLSSALECRVNEIISEASADPSNEGPRVRFLRDAIRCKRVIVSKAIAQSYHNLGQLSKLGLASSMSDLCKSGERLQTHSDFTKLGTTKSLTQAIETHTGLITYLFEVFSTDLIRELRKISAKELNAIFQDQKIDKKFLDNFTSRMIPKAVDHSSIITHLWASHVGQRLITDLVSRAKQQLNTIDDSEQAEQAEDIALKRKVKAELDSQEMLGRSLTDEDVLRVVHDISNALVDGFIRNSSRAVVSDVISVFLAMRGALRFYLIQRGSDHPVVGQYFKTQSNPTYRTIIQQDFSQMQKHVLEAIRQAYKDEPKQQEQPGVDNSQVTSQTKSVEPNKAPAKRVFMSEEELIEARQQATGQFKKCLPHACVYVLYALLALLYALAIFTTAALCEGLTQADIMQWFIGALYMWVVDVVLWQSVRALLYAIFFTSMGKLI